MEIEGIVERFAPDLMGHGEHGFHILFEGKNTLYHFRKPSKAYCPLGSAPSEANAVLVKLTAPGAAVFFQIADRYVNHAMVEVTEGTLRNPTLEQRLGYEIKDAPPVPSDHR